MSWRKERRNKNDRHTKFTQAVFDVVMKRQNGKCAVCGSEKSSMIGHHVFPKRSYCGSSKGFPDTSFMKSSENCVAVCTLCHIKFGHDGDFVNGIAGADIFIHAHDGEGGKMSGTHIRWVEKLLRIQRGGCDILKANIRRGRKIKHPKIN